MDNGSIQEFEISISYPEKIEDQFQCLVKSDGVLSNIDLKAYGIDSIDAIEYAIHLLDILIFERDNNFEVLWPDKSCYNRSKTLSYRWTSE